MVSTDDDEIADIAQHYGALVPFRRTAQTADDFATTADVLTEVLAQYAALGQQFTYACCLYPTAPFVTQSLLQQAFERLITGGFRLCVSGAAVQLSGAAGDHVSGR